MTAVLRKYRRLLRYALRQWSALLAILGLSAASSAVSVLQPWPMKLLLDHALGATSPSSTRPAMVTGFGVRFTPESLIVLAALASVMLFVFSSALEAAITWAWTAAGQRMVYDLAAELLHRLQRLSQLFHSRHSTGDSLSRLTGDTWCVYTVADALLISPAQHLLTLLTVGLVAWRLDAWLATLSLVIAPVLAASVFFFGNRLKHRTKLSREAQSRLTSFTHQTLTAVPVVQAFASERHNARQFRTLAEAAVCASQRGTLLNNVYNLVNGCTATLGTAVILYAGGQRVLEGALSVGSFVVFLAYVRTLQSAALGLLRTYGNLKSVEASADRVLEILDVEETVRDTPGALQLPATSGGRHVRLENITFGYEAGLAALKNVSLEARPGETVAIVGHSGAGKSTLVSLIPRFFDPWQGQVSFDGHDLRHLQLESVRSQVALVLQEPFLLPLSLAANIAYGRPGASREAVEAAARAANAHHFIERLPQGYDTIIGERGATLSGGERQRIAIARALLKDAPVLILDEPTSALDAQTEVLLLEALERLMQGRTTFIIAHRLSTIRRADRIVVLEGGEVAECGSHRELIAAHGAYHRLHEAQRLRAQRFSGLNREAVA